MTGDGAREKFLANRNYLVSKADAVDRKNKAHSRGNYSAYRYQDITNFQRFVWASLDMDVWAKRSRQQSYEELETVHRVTLLIMNSSALYEVDWFIGASSATHAKDIKLSAVFSPLTADQERVDALRYERLSRLLSLRRCTLNYIKGLTTEKFKARIYYQPNLAEGVVYVLMGLWCFIAWATSFVSLAYPFVDAALHYNSFNLLQRVFLYSSAVCLLIVVLSMPGWWLDYVPFLLTQRGNIKHYSTSSDVKVIVGKYHVPSPEHVLLREVPRSMLPRDVVVNVLAPFLDENSIDTSRLTVKQCEAYRAQL